MGPRCWEDSEKGLRTQYLNNLLDRSPGVGVESAAPHIGEGGQAAHHTVCGQLTVLLFRIGARSWLVARLFLSSENEPLTNLDISNIAVHGRSAENEDRVVLFDAVPASGKKRLTLPTVQLIEAHEAMQGTPWQGPSRLQALERGVHGIGNPETRPFRSVAGAPMRPPPLPSPSMRLVGLDQTGPNAGVKPASRRASIKDGAVTAHTIPQLRILLHGFLVSQSGETATRDSVIEEIEMAN
ncbi:uncharacterized protein CLUP02_02607 [Colletotrichum lupini]|uniref:Uncharacterized protein n=1 Tax=Colletotrichum lupini TaxID=145971 RepID=A0A9Q8SHM9_9PEZI|nr:uncharacterized protein CLUP02_02607 [Colletotrichum lupini]UQC77140.1 hypothetical protein CLUP02_02607 [Colletotrichum lupini]